MFFEQLKAGVEALPMGPSHYGYLSKNMDVLGRTMSIVLRKNYDWFEVGNTGGRKTG